MKKKIFQGIGSSYVWQRAIDGPSLMILLTKLLNLIRSVWDMKVKSETS